MDNIVKQRLVGALILLALGVVFWPIIFVPEADQVSVVTVEVPEEPPVDLSPLPEPDNLGLRRGGDARAQKEPPVDVALPDAQGAGEAGDNGPVAPRSEVLRQAGVDDARSAVGEPELDDDGLPIAFALQVATMAQQARAESLRDELVAAGYKGYLKRMRRDDRFLYRVLVGPKFNRDELTPIKAAVDERWKVDSLIMRYLP